MQIPKRKSEKNNQFKPDYLITKAKFEELQKNLEHLLKQRPGAAEDVARLSQLGDFSENAEYQLAKGRLRGINSAIFSLEQELNKAVIIDPQKQTDTVQLGHRVTVTNNQNQQKIYQILGSKETNPQQGIISHNSPLGTALLGKKIGETISFKAGDKEVFYKIIRIE